MCQSDTSSDSPVGRETPPGSELTVAGYKLPMMTRDDFDLINQLMLSVFAQGRKRQIPFLTRVTVDNEGFNEDHTSYLSTEKPLGCTMVENSEWDRFSVWITPSYTEDSHSFRLTLTHELTHGYVGVGYQHGVHWRRWYYRVLKHLDLQGLLLRDPDELILHTAFYQGIRYVRNLNHYVRERLLVEEAFAKAEREHEAVMSDLLGRLPYLRSC